MKIISGTGTVNAVRVNDGSPDSGWRRPTPDEVTRELHLDDRAAYQAPYDLLETIQDTRTALKNVQGRSGVQRIGTDTISFSTGDTRHEITLPTPPSPGADEVQIRKFTNASTTQAARHGSLFTSIPSVETVKSVSGLTQGTIRELPGGSPQIACALHELRKAAARFLPKI